jgi:hypothetical protein
MKVYVASKFENTKVVQEAYKNLLLKGHTITHDWTLENAEGMTGEALHAYLQGCAERDLAGVEAADALLLINHANGCGMYTELGIALASNKFIVVIDGKKPPHNIFFNLTHIHHAKDLGDAIKILAAHEWFLKAGKE